MSPLGINAAVLQAAFSLFAIALPRTPQHSNGKQSPNGRCSLDLFIPAVFSGKWISPNLPWSVSGPKAMWNSRSLHSLPQNSWDLVSSSVKVKILRLPLIFLVNDYQEISVWVRGSIAQCKTLLVFVHKTFWASCLGHSLLSCRLAPGEIYGLSGPSLPSPPPPPPQA